ncbi:MAG: glycosyltransferase [Candidatus Dojkabacteria bacterium]|jgi:glycosyltransferase involved in cell wall biosynthesis|nr:glycosyltransferase [Candidatus Dojkabacteria bacterium]
MSNQFNPKVSIVIPVYNGSNYVKEAIDSALSQTYKNVEVIVINDGSTDGGKTDEICKSYGKKIRYFLKENGGPASALNMGIEKMEGEYFSWLSHDDVYYPEKVEKQVQYLKKLGKKDVILYADYELIDSDSKFISNVIFEHEVLINKPEYALLRGCVNGITLLIPKVAFDKHGGFDLELKCTQDYDMWKRFLTDYEFIHMKEIFSKTRIHPLQDSNKHPNVTTEGNPLWIEMMESIPKERKEELEGTEYNFYRKMRNFLKETPYRKAQKLAEKRMEEILKNTKSFPETKVTVIIPFYNRFEILIQSIESVLKQTYRKIEIILVNDCSTEDLKQIKKYIVRDKRIKLISLEKNSGPAVARNRGIAEASGEYIVFLDSDDLFTKEKIEKQLLQTVLSNVNISHTSYIRKGWQGEELIKSGVLSGYVMPEIIASCPIATPTVMIKSEFLKRNKFKFSENFRIGEDVCFWMELLQADELLGINTPYTIVNVNPESAYQDLNKQLEGLANILSYVLSKPEFRAYHLQISNLCEGYSYTSRKIQDKEVQSAYSVPVKKRNFIETVKNFINLIKYQGFITTFKKVIRKYLLDRF